MDGSVWKMNKHRSSDPSLQTSGAGTHFCGESFLTWSGRILPKWGHFLKLGDPSVPFPQIPGYSIPKKNLIRQDGEVPVLYSALAAQGIAENMGMSTFRPVQTVKKCPCNGELLRCVDVSHS